MTNIFHTLLKPQSIAVIGASRSPQKVGYQLLKNIIDDGYSGKIYPVNPSASKILGLKAYPTLTSIGEKIDLPIIVTPAGVVYPILNECQSLGSKAAIVITAGFSESGSQGQLLQQKIQQLTKSQQFRILGPNCLGVLSPVYHLNATFGPPLPKKGNVCLISQSGALVTGVLDWVKKQGLGLSHAITLGNRLDINETEALEFAFQDTHTKVIMMYLESFASATDFFSLCSRVSPHKPILLLKGGQSAAGVAASASHTAALATNFTLVSALARQTGVILSDTIQSWLTSAVIMADSKSFYSDRMAIITNAGGPGVLATDEAIAHHLRVVPFSRTTTEKLARKLSLGVVHNPLDLLGDASPEDFLQALSLIDTDSQVDLIHLIMTPQTTTKPVATARMIIHAYPKLKKPLFISLLGGDKMTPAKRLLENIGIPVYTYPNEAITTIATKNWYLKHRRGFYYYPAQKPSYATKSELVRLRNLLSQGVTLDTAFKILKTYSFNLPKYRLVDRADQLAEALNYVERPAVLKTASLNLAHKAKFGGVYLDLNTTYHARVAFSRLQRLGPQILVQETIHGAIEIILGCRRDPQLGPFITIGLGGSLTDAIGDRAYAFIPTQTSYLEYIFKNTRAFQLLAQKHLSIKPMLDVMQKLSAIMLDLPQISEIEINPLIVTNTRVYACDIKITLL